MRDSGGPTTLRPDRKPFFFAGCIHGRHKRGSWEASWTRRCHRCMESPPPPALNRSRPPSAGASPPNGNHAGAGNLDLFHLFESIFFIDSCCLLPLFVMPLLQLLASCFPMLLICCCCCLLLPHVVPVLLACLLLPCAAATCLC